MQTLVEFRMTRRRPYVLCDCPGRSNVRARQGYYIRASNLQGAEMVMREHFPEDAQFGFDGEVWKLPQGMSIEHYNEMMGIMV